MYQGTFMTEKIIDKIGISKERHEEIIQRLSGILGAARCGSYTSTSRLITLIADEPIFSKKECVYIGILLAATYDHDDN
jgi:hypothetical protein